MKYKLLTVNDVMNVFKISRRTVYYWIKRNILHPIRIGSVYRFHPVDIEALIEKNHPKGMMHRKKRILAIDDDLLVRESLKHLLEQEGYEATVVSSGREALDILLNSVFDLVITDIRMPKMDGIETIKAIRKQQERFGKPKLPAIVLTAYDDQKVRRSAEKLGVRKFMTKPFDRDKFFNNIKKSLR